MTSIDWGFLAMVAIAVTGFMEWLKGFFTKASGKTIQGNILRVIQLILCFCFAWAFLYLPPFVKNGLTVLSITTLGKDSIPNFVKTIFSKKVETPEIETTKEGEPEK